MDFSREELAGLNNNSLYHALGIEVLEAAGGRARGILRPEPAGCWPFNGQPHGGVLFTLMDTTMAWAVISLLERGKSCATVSMEVQYTQRALGGEFICEAWTTFQTGRLVYTRADVKNQEGGLIATSQAAFRVVNDYQ
ncbi:MAG: PaaI family thioesterase [Desulfarculus sp.]|jgi:uncharacterized protein (TIGR00369 family)|nr:MAG: PaaI family thioesterase [Desulfarculus sp.]